jgi:hypothetical protein
MRKFLFFRWRLDRGLSGWMFRLYINKGAGYCRWVFGQRIPTGWTFWAGHGLQGGEAAIQLRHIAFGFTTNASKVPWVEH